MTEENLDWLDDIADKLIANEKITEEEADDLLNYVRIPGKLNKQLSPEVIRYIDLIDNYELVDELPENPLDTGGHEYLAKSIETANLTHANRQLDENERTHLITDLIRPLEFIFTGTDTKVFQSVVKVLTNEPSPQQGKYLSKEVTEELEDKAFKEVFFSSVGVRATDTFMDKVREYVNFDKEDLFGDDEQRKRAIREFLPDLEEFKYSNTKVENVLMRSDTSLLDTLTAGGFKTDIAGRNDRKKGESYGIAARVELPAGVSLPGGFEYTRFKRTIVSAVGNAYDLEELRTQKAGKQSIRVDHLVNLINGDDLTTDVRPGTVDKLIKEIEPLTTVRVEIDATEHAAYNRQKNKKFQLERNNYKGFLLPVEFQEVKEFSKSKQIYMHILKRPVLYDYASNTGQFIKVSRQTLNLTKQYLEDGTEKETVVKQMTHQRVIIRDYILGEIYGRGRNFKDKPVKITYKSIYEVVENDLGKKPRKQTLDKNIENVATALQQKKEIRKYKIIPSGRTKLHRLDIYHNK